jgi:putative ABC transport system permease protein
MSLLRRFTDGLRVLLGRQRAEREMSEELEAYLDAAVNEKMRAGMSREDALRTARVEIGSTEAVKEAIRGAGWEASVESVWQDVRYGLRQLRRNPGFTAVAVITLALGIGANTAIFSLLYAVLLQPLPYRNSSRLVVLHETTPNVGTVGVSYPNFLDWRAASRAFSQMAAVASVDFNLAGISQPENIKGDAVSPNFLSMMGVHPFLGRDFEGSEEKAGTAPVILLSYSLWRSQFGADPNAVGRTINLDGRGFTIAGVLPPSYRGIDKTDVIEPIGVWATGDSVATERADRGDLVVVGRLAPGVGLTQAHAEMEGIEARLAKEYPQANQDYGVKLRPIRDVFVSGMRPAILVLFAAVMFVLLIACANVANLFLVRGAARRKEMALRLAFGASRSRIIRQMLTESFVLAFLGGVLGLALAIGGIRGMARLIPTDMLSGATINLNSAVLLFTTAVVVLAAFIFGLAPMAQSTKLEVQAELKEGARTTSGGRAQGRLRGVLAMAEISLALVLLVGAGLMMKSLSRLLSVRPGFEPNHVLTMEIDLRTEQYSKDPAMLSFWQQVLERARALPGVKSAAAGTVVPFTDSHDRTDITIEGMPLVSLGSWPHPDIHVVSPGYVSTLRISLLRGRAFTDADKKGASPVALVNQMLAQKFFPREDPIGKRFIFGHPSAKKPGWTTIVGVVGNTKLYGLANPARLEVYVPLQQYPQNDMNLVVKSAVNPSALISEIRGAVASIDKGQPIFAISTMKQLVSDSSAERRITLVLLGAFSGLALVLAAIGIYGVLSYSAAQRTHEIGIRMALGAQKRDVLRVVLGQGMTLAAIGVGIGIVAALGLTRLMASLLYGVKPTDPLTFTAVSFILGGVALAACYIPARRAASVDPIEALRYE